MGFTSLKSSLVKDYAVVMFCCRANERSAKGDVARQPSVKIGGLVTNPESTGQVPLRRTYKKAVLYATFHRLFRD